MSEASASARPWLRVLVAFAAGAALSVGAGFALFGGGSDTPAPAASPAIPAPEASVPAFAPPPPPPAAPATSHSVAPSGKLELERAAFPTSGPVRVSLELPEMSADAEPRPVRLVSQPDHRILELPGALDSGRTAATIEVDPNYLQPGTYLVEMQTTERSHFPLRRYVIVVR
jgi:hypothetical protein